MFVINSQNVIVFDRSLRLAFGKFTVLSLNRFKQQCYIFSQTVDTLTEYTEQNKFFNLHCRSWEISVFIHQTILQQSKLIVEVWSAVQQEMKKIEIKDDCIHSTRKIFKLNCRSWKMCSFTHRAALHRNKPHVETRKQHMADNCNQRRQL